MGPDVGRDLPVRIERGHRKAGTCPWHPAPASGCADLRAGRILRFLKQNPRPVSAFPALPPSKCPLGFHQLDAQGLTLDPYVSSSPLTDKGRRDYFH